MRIYNTMTRKKEEFIPLEEGKVKMYACGPTVYNYFHIGNARPFIIFDTLRRYFEFKGYEVTFIQNFTDIDDKLIIKAQQEGITVEEVGKRYIEEYYKDSDALGIKRATLNPKATEHIPEIIDLVQSLIDKGHAYEAGGDVYFDVESFPDYGKLSGQPLESLEVGARIEAGDVKKHPMDFVLWKAQKPGEPAWDSPWGKGRPGWHIECSAMSMKYLGPTFDIHSGGQDLVFPHHENEIAQSECATGHPFARYWMHNGYINVDNRKMSKSLGNFFTVRDISKEFDLQSVRLFMLSSQYRNPINFSKELIEQADTALDRIRNAKHNMEFVAKNGSDSEEGLSEYLEKLEQHEKEFIAAMDDDLNTADALGCIFELVRDANTYLNETSSKKAAEKSLEKLNRLTGVLGLLDEKDDKIPKDIIELAEKRQQAREDKDFKLADSIRDIITSKGYTLEDTPSGPKINRA